MAWFAREFIAVPDERKNQLVYKWPDNAIRRFSRALVGIDETALFVRSGEVVAVMGPGRHRIDADALPGLGAIVDSLTGGNCYRAELYFVATREITGVPFGGRLTDITDPVSAQVVSLRTHGEFALTARDPAVLITSLVGSTDLTDSSRLHEWSAALLVKAMKVAVTQRITRGEWSVLGISGHLPDIEGAVVRDANIALYDYGLRIARIGDVDISLVPEDAQRLKRLAKDRTYIGLAGDLQRYAAAELALGASAGLSASGGDANSVLATSLAYSTLRSPTVPAVPPWSAVQRQAPACGGCGGLLGDDARFCPACGRERPASPCGSCGAELPAAARFCSRCGHPTTS